MMRHSSKKRMLHTGIAMSLSVLSVSACSNPSGVPSLAGPGDSSASTASAERAPQDGSNDVANAANVESASQDKKYSSEVNAQSVTMTATASSSKGSFVPSRAVDGDTSTEWQSGSVSNPTLTVDMGESKALTGLGFKMNPGVGSYTVETSADGSTWTSALSNQSNTTWGVETKKLTATARYLRFKFANSGKNVMVFEVQPQGSAASSSGGTVTADAVMTATATSTSGSYVAARAVDGNTDTEWQSGAVSSPALTVNMGEVKALTSFGFKMNTGSATYTVETSMDGSTWKTALSNQSNSSWNVETKTLNATAQYLRFKFTNNGKGVMVFEVVPHGTTVAASPTPSPSSSTSTSTSPTPAPSSSPSASPSPSPSATPAPTTTTTRAPITTPLSNIAGMDASSYAPTNRSTFMAVAPDGSRVAIAWLHNADSTGAFSTTGEPTTYATIGNPASAGSFSSPQLVGKRTLAYSSTTNQKYNSAHNAPYVIAQPNGGFKALSVPNNANGYAEGLSATGNGYANSDVAAGSTGWSAPGLAKLASASGGSSLSEITGTADGAGNLHMFGQGHLGAFQGGFAYQRLRAGSSSWEDFDIASAYRPSGMNYFLEGAGYVSPVRNSAGSYDLYAAFAYNKQGSAPNFGLYYVVSHDGGSTWHTASGSSVSLPMAYGSSALASAAVVPAALTTGGTYSGSIPGFRAMSVCASDTGAPVIVRPQYSDSTQSKVQHYVFTYVSGHWAKVAVGYPVMWNAAGTGCAYNSATGKVNVLLLDPGSSSVPGKVLLYSESLADLQAGKASWTAETVASITNTSGITSSLKACEVRNTRFEVLVEANYTNPGRVKPVLVEAPMR